MEHFTLLAGFYIVQALQLQGLGGFLSAPHTSHFLFFASFAYVQVLQAHFGLGYYREIPCPPSKGLYL